MAQGQSSPVTPLFAHDCKHWRAGPTIFITLGANAVVEAFARGLADEIAFKRRLTLSERLH